MICQVSIGEVYASIDTDEPLTPEHALDLLNRCADAALRVFAGLPDQP